MARGRQSTGFHGIKNESNPMNIEDLAVGHQTSNSQHRMRKALGMTINMMNLDRITGSNQPEECGHPLLTGGG